MSSLEFDNFEEMENDEEIQAMIYRATSRYKPYLDKHTIDSEVNWTLFRVWELHDESKGKVSTYLYSALFNNLNRLLRKKYDKPSSFRMKKDPFKDVTIPDEETFEILDILSEQEKEIIINRGVYGETFKSIGERLKMKPHKVSSIYNNSVKKVKKDCIG